LDELRLALELGGDGAELDLDLAAVDVAFDLLQLGTREAGSNPLDVTDDRPGLVDRSIHGEFVDDLLCHRRTSSKVSMSSGDPLQGTSSTRSALKRVTTRAPSSPLVGSSGQTALCRRDGLRRLPSYVATAIGAVDPATRRHASGVMSGWSPS